MDDAALAAEIAPCFVTEADGRRTDVVCLACTHYPLLLPRLEALAPWPVTWIDPAPAIARRVIAADRPRPARRGPGRGRARRLHGRHLPDRRRCALPSPARGIGEVAVEAMPLPMQ